MELAELLKLLDRVVRHSPRGRGACLLSFELVHPRIAVRVLLATFLDLLAGVVARAADHSRAHEWAPPSHEHRVDLLSLCARADGLLLSVQGVLQLALGVFHSVFLSFRSSSSGGCRDPGEGESS